MPPKRAIGRFNRRLLAYAGAALAVFACLTVIDLSQLPASVANDASLVAKHDRESLGLGQSAHVAWRVQSGRLYEHRDHPGLPEFRASSAVDRRLRDLLAQDYGTPAAEPGSEGGAGWTPESAKLLCDRYAAMFSQPEPRHRRLLPGNASHLLASLEAAAGGAAELAGLAEFPAGSQLKLLLRLGGGCTAVFKPRVYDRDRVMTGSPVAGRDRDNAEVVGYHLGRLLGFHRGPVAAPRILNLTAAAGLATPRLKATFYHRQRDGRLCLWGVCHYCRGPRDGVCADEAGRLEGAAVLMLPEAVRLVRHRHPWARNYAPGGDAKAAWQLGSNPCSADLLRRLGPGVLLDLVDTAVLDFLLGNADRHEFETASLAQAAGGEGALMVSLDHGKGLGNPHHDEVSILAPLQQCCRLRAATRERLLAMQGILGAAVQAALARASASQSPLTGPLLTPAHATALDRRLGRALRELDKCTRRLGPRTVLVEEDAGLRL